MIRLNKLSIASLLSAALVLSSLIGLSTPQNVSAANTCSDVYAALPAWITNAINLNKGFYQTASDATGVPWELLAAIHYRETSFSHSNPSNGQGIFQFANGDGGPYPTGPVSDTEFVRQLTYMAQKIQSDYVYRGSLTYTHRALTQNEADDFRVQDTLFSYNGRTSLYAQQGVQYGFNATTQPYEGSPYVMNMYDCVRANMGIITKDYGTIDGVDTRYGAFTLYVRLKSDNYWQTRYDFLGKNMTLSLPGCTEATNTTVECIWKLSQLSTNAPAVATSTDQRNQLIAFGYKLEGKAFFGNVARAPQTGNVPIYQLQKPDGTIFLTADQNEYNYLKTDPYMTDLGIGFYADPSYSNAGYPVYRLYKNGVHVWTGSLDEKNRYLSSGYSDEGIAFTSISTVRQEVPASSDQLLVYRFSKKPGYGHFWTTNLTERDALITAGGYGYEGVAWHASAAVTTTPVYRLYALSTGKHLFTTDKNEKDVLSAGTFWVYEGIAYYASPTPTSKPVYRLYTPISANHLLTTDVVERQSLINSKAFNDEGIAFYVY